MKKTLQLLLLIVLLLLTLIGWAIIVDTLRIDVSRIYANENLRLLIFAVMGSFAILLKIKQLRRQEQTSIPTSQSLDHEFKQSVELLKNPFWVKVLLINHLIFSLYNVWTGLQLFELLLERFPLSQLPDGIDRYALATGIIVFGILLFIDAFATWRVLFLKAK